MINCQLTDFLCFRPPTGDRGEGNSIHSGLDGTHIYIYPR